jgi:ornithine cyclodeaminase/alanine dehydrogenase-like protein (mu-crystallin family)
MWRRSNRGFRRYAEGQAELSDVVHLNGQDGAFHIKAAGLGAPQARVAVKVNANFVHNPTRFGLPTIQGAILLCDARTGGLLAIMDSIEITINRTGAATALAARCLARPDAAVATVCGCGVQGRVQLRALAHVLPLRRVYAVDTRADVARAFAVQMATELGIDVRVPATLREATAGSDVIATCTPAQRPLLTVADVSPGVFVAAIGADSPEKQELDPRLVAASTLVVDILAQCAAMGELHHALEAGLMSPAGVHAELGEVLAGSKPGRRAAEETIVFDATGTGIQDVAAATAVYERALERGAGLWCALA